MANKKPIQTDAFKAQQRPRVYAEAMGPTRGTRYRKEVDHVLQAMPTKERQALIRAAVEAELGRRGLI